ncbi:TIGR02391 family protein [Rhizobium sp. S152]|uniref:TIGR02391 family protein n=1 Tax=Rhizobium sp. S152 TaxID=3055038 RepID=UPI0025A96246|nr:TIGR02391 family protein [Rhizobium sp. S152]MDM9628525.1 TIGR02391 family protein [Rhizobium sp. S152]
MFKKLEQFERIARTSRNLGTKPPSGISAAHPFDERNIHTAITKVSKALFDNGHYSQATFEAFKFLDAKVKNLSGVNDSGHGLMMNAFGDKNTKIKLTDMITQSEQDEQSGYKFIFAGSMSAIRNPRGHEIVHDSIDQCLDHLSMASQLLRRIEERKWPL